MGIAWAEAMSILEEENPGVTIEFEEKGFEQIRQTGAMVLTSGEAPDVMMYNKGSTATGILTTEGLLTDLTPIVEEHGWDEIIPPSLAATARYDEQGLMGSGNWYGVSGYAEYLMVFYNADLLDEHGLSVPTTIDELEAAMQTFVDAGITPLALAGAEYPAQHLWYQLGLAEADRDFVEGYQFFTGDVALDGPELTAGSERLQAWVDAGYISTDATGLRAEDMGVDFTSGDYPMMVSGSWFYSRFMNEITDFEWTAALFPDSDFHVGSSGNLWVVPEGAQHKDLAYEFIDITMRDEIQNLLAESGAVPVAGDPGSVTDPKSAELMAMFEPILEQDGLAHFPDWPVPGFYDTLVAKVQELMLGQGSVESILGELDTEYQDHKASLGK